MMFNTFKHNWDIVSSAGKVCTVAAILFIMAALAGFVVVLVKFPLFALYLGVLVGTWVLLISAVYTYSFFTEKG